MHIRKLALFAIWKVSSVILGPVGRKTPAWLRESSAGAQPWLLAGCYVPSQTFSKFFSFGIGIEFARSKHLSMQWAFPSPWHSSTHGLITVRIWKTPGWDGQWDSAWDGDGSPAPAARGRSTQVWWGQLTHMMELQPPSISFHSAWLFVLIRYQPIASNQPRRCWISTPAGFRGYQRRKVLQPHLARVHLTSAHSCFSISLVLRGKKLL